MIRSAIAGAVLLAGVAGCKQAKTSWDLDGGDQITVGQAFARQRLCPDCHDPGDGTMAGSTTARPMTSAYAGNLTPDPQTGIGGWADIEIVRAIRYGVDADEAPLCPAMPHFATPDQGDPITDLEANAIVAWLRSLPPVAREIPESECPPLKPPPPPDLLPPPDLFGPHDLAVVD